MRHVTSIHAALAVFLALVSSLAGCASAARHGAAPARDLASRADASVIVFSDLHFDPLADPALAPALVQAPASDWTRIFEQSASASRPAGYGSDSNYALLKSALAGMRAASPAADLVLFTGDLFPHKFEANFQRVTHDSQHADFEAFAAKTAQFVAATVRGGFPGSLVLPVIGNNDSPCGDYMSQPRSPFLANFGDAWGQPLTDLGDASVLLPAAAFQGKVRVIAMNDVYWSRRYSNGCGIAAEHPDADQLAWLRAELAGADARGEAVWIVGHIPAGIDLHTSFVQHPNLCSSQDNVVPFLAPRRATDWAGALAEHAGAIRVILTGHTHMNELRLYAADSDKAVPSLGVPSVSPLFSNNPAFEVLGVARDSGEIRDVRAYALDLSASSPAWTMQYALDQEYGVSGLSAPELRGLLPRLAEDTGLQAKYAAHFTGGSASRDLAISDWKAYLCGMTHFEADSFSACYCGRR